MAGDVEESDVDIYLNIKPDSRCVKKDQRYIKYGLYTYRDTSLPSSEPDSSGWLWTSSEKSTLGTGPSTRDCS